MPTDFDADATPSQCLLEALNHVSENSHEECALVLALATRLAQFGLRTSTKLKNMLLADAVSCLASHNLNAAQGEVDNIAWVD